MRYVIKWTNKYSGETGYIENLDGNHKHFINAWYIQNAKYYSSRKNATRAVKKLMLYGEGENNIFDIISTN